MGGSDAHSGESLRQAKRHKVLKCSRKITFQDGWVGLRDQKENSHGWKVEKGYLVSTRQMDVGMLFRLTMVLGQRWLALGHLDGSDAQRPDIGLGIIAGLSDADYDEAEERRASRSINGAQIRQKSSD